jgi:hypothetical protein
VFKEEDYDLVLTKEDWLELGAKIARGEFDDRVDGKALRVGYAQLADAMKSGRWAN